MAIDIEREVLVGEAMAIYFGHPLWPLKVKLEGLVRQAGLESIGGVQSLYEDVLSITCVTLDLESGMEGVGLSGCSYDKYTNHPQYGRWLEAIEPLKNADSLDGNLNGHIGLLASIAQQIEQDISPFPKDRDGSSFEELTFIEAFVKEPVAQW